MPRTLRYGLRVAEHARTAIRRLFISGLRSVRLVELPSLPDIVVLHGPNGAGKSTLLLAAQLAVRAAAQPGSLPVGRARAVPLSLAEADHRLGLRPSDFHVGVSPVIRVGLDVALGTRAGEILRTPKERSLGLLQLELVVELVADDEIRYWFERAELDGAPFGEVDASPETVALQQQILEARDRVDQQRKIVDGQRTALAALERRETAPRETSADIDAQRAQALLSMKGQSERLRSLESEVRRLEAQLDNIALPPERAQRALLPRLIQVSPAYRVPGDESDPEAALHEAALSSDRLQRDAMRRLGKRLSQAGLFGSGAEPVTLVPVNAPRYGERQMLLGHPIHGELPLRNLGSGEQQVVLMLGQSVITPFPIAHIEEPEAHLHKTLMEPLARVLRDAVLGTGTPDVDQLWIATHHHLFAIAERYFDVRLDADGATQVEERPREEAIEHFYEPHPYWETLRALLEEGMLDADAVLLEDESGPVRARDILASIRGDRQLANRYVAASTKALVLSLAQERRGK